MTLSPIRVRLLSIPLLVGILAASLPILARSSFDDDRVGAIADSRYQPRDSNVIPDVWLQYGPEIKSV
jgi:hypothetical protein